MKLQYSFPECIAKVKLIKNSTEILDYFLQIEMSEITLQNKARSFKIGE